MAVLFYMVLLNAAAFLLCMWIWVIVVSRSTAVNRNLSSPCVQSTTVCASNNCRMWCSVSSIILHTSAWSKREWNFYHSCRNQWSIRSFLQQCSSHFYMSFHSSTMWLWWRWCMVLSHTRMCTSIFVSAGSLLTVCEESCHVVITIRNRCQSQFISINENRSADLLDYISNFNCSSPETYLIPGLPTNTQRCIPADDLCEYFSAYNFR